MSRPTPSRSGKRQAARESDANEGMRITMGYKVAIVGATGNVGREMLNILDEIGRAHV